MATIGSRPADPVAGATGHFAHHTWCGDAIEAINTDLSAVTAGASIDVTDIAALQGAEALAIIALVRILDTAGIVTATGLPE